MKVLFISIAAPPKTGPESIQVSKVLEELLAQNVEVKFLTEKIGYNSWSTNVSSKMVEDSSLEVHEIPTHNSLVNKLSNKPLFKEIFYPDNKFLFHRRILSQNLFKDIEVIYSRSLPLSSAIAAYKIKKLTNRPWIMHLSDPWTINKVNTVRKKDHLWEKRCLELADIVTFTNQEIITAYSKIYPQFTDKFKLFTNAYKNGEEAIKYRIADSFTIVHTGNLYKPKDPKIFLTAYKAFLESLDKTARKHVNCIFVGHVDEEIKKNTLGFGENLELRSQISFEEALELQKNADLLLNVGVNLPNRTDDLFFQSKLVDYMTARRPILAITGIDSPTYKFVNSGYGKAFSFSDFDGILKFLKAIYNKKDFELAPVDPTYSVANNVENLISWFNVLKNE